MEIKPLNCIYGKCIIPQRYMLTFMLFLAIVNCYNMRMCIYVVITEIATAEPVPNMTATQCPKIDNETHKVLGPTQDWSVKQKRIILTSFFPGYLIMHVPSGIVADMYDSKRLLSLSVLVSAFMTILTPAVIQNLNWWFLVILRFFIGLAQAPLYPAITAMLAHWIPARQRGLLGSIAFSGMQIGMITGTFCSDLIIRFFNNWLIIFYIWGSLAIVWYLFFIFTCYTDPGSHPYITSVEKEKLENDVGCRLRVAKIPWKDILNDKSCWALIVAQCGHDWIIYTVEIDFPIYLKTVLQYTITQNAWISAVPFAGFWVCDIISGWLGDFLINKGLSSVLGIRKMYTTISSVGPSTLALMGTYMGCNRNLAVAFFIFGMSAMGPYHSGLSVNVLELTLHFTGTVIGLSNGVGVLTGIVAPYLVAFVAVEQSLVEWQTIFWVTYVVCTVTCILYMVWASADRCEWDKSPAVVE